MTIAATATATAINSGCIVCPELTGAWSSNQKLGAVLPTMLWLHKMPEGFAGGEILIGLKDLNGKSICPLVWQADGKVKIGVDLERSIYGLQREEYRPPLLLPIAAKLPFNYNVLPNFSKGLLKNLLDLRKKPKTIEFPEIPFDLSCDFLIVLDEIHTNKSNKCIWPNRNEIALTLSHDVDTAWVLRHRKMLEQIVDLEKAYGFRSTWHLVSSYLDDEDVKEPLRWLQQCGHELASHGDNHDTRHAFSNLEEREQRWEIIVKHAREYEMTGIRSAWLSRTPALFDDMSRMGVFAYDSSIPNCERMGVKETNSGCGSMRPFFIRPNLVELPVGPRLEDLAKHDPDLVSLSELLRKLRVSQGFLTINMHPQPHQSANQRVLGYYERVLELFASQDKAWCCLQRDVADWFLEVDDT